MDPVTVGLMVANMGMAIGGAQQRAAQRRQEAMIRAAEVEAAPWTKNAPQSLITTPAPNVWAEMAGAGVNTAGQYAALKKAGLFDDKPSKNDPNDLSQMNVNDPVLAAEQIKALEGFEMNDAQTQPSFYQSGSGGYSPSGFGASGIDDSLWQTMVKKGAIA